MLRKQRQWNCIKFQSKTQEAEESEREKVKNRGNKQKRVTNIVDVNSNISLTTLNINVLMNQLKDRADSLEKTMML